MNFPAELQCFVGTSSQFFVKIVYFHHTADCVILALRIKEQDSMSLHIIHTVNLIIEATLGPK